MVCSHLESTLRNLCSVWLPLPVPVIPRCRLVGPLAGVGIGFCFPRHPTGRKCRTSQCCGLVFHRSAIGLYRALLVYRGSYVPVQITRFSHRPYGTKHRTIRQSEHLGFGSIPVTRGFSSIRGVLYRLILVDHVVGVFVKAPRA